MRDIRDDLEELIDMLELQISGVQGVFEQQVERLKKERDSRVAELKTDLDAAHRVMKTEQRRYSETSQSQQTAANTNMRGLRRAS